MSDNNTMYRMFRQMIQGYKLGKEGENLFVHAVHCWMDLNPENPFAEDSEAFDHFFRMKNYYNVWKLRSADQKISERRMINAARDLCATKPKNPYKFDKKEAEDEKAALRAATIKQKEEEISIQQEADRQKAEREREIKEILEEIRKDDLENQSALEANRQIVEEAKAEAIKNSAVKAPEYVPAEEKKNYVFNVVEEPNVEINEEPKEEPKEEPEEEPKAEKKGFLSKLFRR